MTTRMTEDGTWYSECCECKQDVVLEKSIELDTPDGIKYICKSCESKLYNS